MDHMSEHDVIKRAKSSSLKLLFDTNALFSGRRILELCDQASQLNSIHQERNLELFVSAAAHAEKLFDLKQQHRDEYDEAKIVEGLARKGLTIHSFETRHAAQTAILLGEAFPDPRSWHAAKRQQCLHCLGINEHVLNSSKSGTGKRCGATIDWLIAAHAKTEDCVLVTDDEGIEFRLVERVKLGTLERAMQRMLDETTTAD